MPAECTNLDNSALALPSLFLIVTNSVELYTRQNTHISDKSPHKNKQKKNTQAHTYPRHWSTSFPIPPLRDPCGYALSPSLCPISQSSPRISTQSAHSAPSPRPLRQPVKRLQEHVHAAKQRRHLFPWLLRRHRHLHYCWHRREHPPQRMPPR